MSTYTASKIGMAWDGVYISVAVGLYSATFLLTDALGEIWGRKYALRAVLAGFVGQAFLVVTNLLVVAAEPAPFWGNQDAFQTVLGASTRLVFASVLAYGAAQLNDVFVFDALKRATRGRWLFLRNIGSTSVSQVIDSVVFFGVGFYGLVPNIWSLIATAVGIKLLIAVIDTPFLYLIRAYHRKGHASDTA